MSDTMDHYEKILLQERGGCNPRNTTYNEGVFVKGLPDFCDLLCKYAEVPKEEGLDGSGSCRTFIALYCKKKKSIVPKNMPCNKKTPKKF